MEGVVAAFDPVLRYGRIEGDDAVSYFVHSTDVIGRRLVLGCRVRFEAAWARGRPRAVGVERLEEAKEG